MHNQRLLHKAKTLPNSSGCYLIKDKQGIIIYIGKAKNLKNRVCSYFNESQKSAKTQILVKRAYEFEFILTKSEAEAFILENNLIKKHSPRYNIQLKDDKSYPYISITNQDWERVLVTRNLNRDNLNFGPFAFVGSARKSLDHLINIYHRLIYLQF